MNELLGIFIGLAAALLQSCSYVVSGAYARESGRPAWTLLAPSFLLMGLAALAGLPFAWPAGRPDWGVMLPVLLFPPPPPLTVRLLPPPPPLPVLRSPPPPQRRKRM